LGGRFQIFTVKTDGSGVQQVTNTAGTNEDPSWAPDGRYLVFSSTRSGRSGLYVSDLAGVNQVQLTDGNGDDTSPSWSARLE
jgi:TolB protein